MFRRLFSLFTIFCLFLLTSRPAIAIYDPTSLPNNRVGVHILSPDEIERAANLVNHDGQGSWGYVTVPIQATDRDYHKWEKFMLKAAELKVIPIIRVATYASGDHWRRPDDIELLDFANFLDDLSWPIQNRYVVIFNEVNRADEYGGAVSPEDYAQILANAITILKSRSEKFFVLPAGLDNAAPNSKGYMRWDTYLKRMALQVPDIFERIDGWTSHAYGNPDFAANPKLSGFNKTDSFRTDLKLLSQYTRKKLPIFVTETGWSNDVLQNSTIATYFTHAMSQTWAQEDIIAVTPFLLFANSDPFRQFSLLNSDLSKTPQYLALQNFSQNGLPLLEKVKESTPVVEISTNTDPKPETEPLFFTFWRNFKQIVQKIGISSQSKGQIYKKLTVGDKSYQIEIVSTPVDRQIGLSKYQYLEPDHGMYFVFEKPGVYGFWMKDMKFDIDIIWIKDGSVIAVNQAYYANPYLTIYPPDNVDTVLELNINSGVKAGDKVALN